MFDPAADFGHKIMRVIMRMFLPGRIPNTV
jgi:hypothetical protein